MQRLLHNHSGLGEYGVTCGTRVGRSSSSIRYTVGHNIRGNDSSTRIHGAGSLHTAIVVSHPCGHIVAPYTPVRYNHSAQALSTSEGQDGGLAPTQLGHSEDAGPTPTYDQVELERARSYKPRLEATIDGQCVADIIQVLHAARTLGLPDAPPALTPHTTDSDTTLIRSVVDHKYLGRRSEELAREYATKKKPVHTGSGVKPSLLSQRITERRRLPIMASQVYSQIVEGIRKSDVTIIVGQTGCGKTTQLPQIILDYALHGGTGAWCNVVCTQPRRVAATSVARRVAFERAEPLGSSVGYAVRFTRRWPRKEGGILYCTAGVLLRRLQTATETTMSTYSHIILDEVHERSLDTDNILTTVRDLVRERKENGKSFPKVILMSATLDAKALKRYFEEPWQSHHSLRSSIIEVEGRTYPITESYLGEVLQAFVGPRSNDKRLMTLLEDPDVKSYIEAEVRFAKGVDVEADVSPAAIDHTASGEDAEEDAMDVEKMLTTTTVPHNLIVATIVHVSQITSKGDLLVFLPGLAQMDEVARSLEGLQHSAVDVTPGGKFRLFKLHSSFAEYNEQVFDPIAKGCRRLILSTNIAETSITLPDVEHVIDTGKQRMLRYSPKSGTHNYGHEWISKSSAAQRKGRAGRVRPGTYYALYTKERLESFPPTTVSEIQRVDLTESVLDLKARPSPPDARDFFNRAPDPPNPDFVEQALLTLRSLGALTEDEQITPLGIILSKISLHPARSKAILLGIVFRCLSPMLFLASHDNEDRLVDHATDRVGAERSRREFANQSESDGLAVYNAFRAYERAIVSGDAQAMTTLETERHVRSRVYRETLLEAEDAYQNLAQEGILPKAESVGSVFQNIPPQLDANSENAPLIKALGLLSLSPGISMRKPFGKNDWTGDGEWRLLTFPRSVNARQVNLHVKYAERLKAGYDLCSFMLKRNSADDSQPWLHDTAMITPLMALLFGHGTQSETDRGLLTIGGWLTATVDIKDDRMNNKVMTTKVLLEMGKAINRFIALAFSEIIGIAGSAEELQAGVTESQQWWLQHSDLRDVFIEGVVKILDQDNKSVVERLKQDRNEAEERQTAYQKSLTMHHVSKKGRRRQAREEEEGRTTLTETHHTAPDSTFMNNVASGLVQSGAP